MSNSSKNILTTRAITYFVISYKKDASIDVDIVPEDAIVTFTCEDLYEGVGIYGDDYMYTTYNLQEVVENLSVYVGYSHISNNMKNQILDFCNTYKNDDNIQILRIVLPKGKVKYTDKDCEEIRNIVNSVFTE